MIKEVIVVEGKKDAARVKQAVNAEIITTNGFNLNAQVVKRIEYAYNTRGIIILTDPDSAGERIRKFLAKRFPLAGHAFVPHSQAIANNDIGIEQASPEAISEALEKVKYTSFNPNVTFNMLDIISADLSGQYCSANRRALLGALLGIGYTNTKQFLYRLNNYGITRAEFEQALIRIGGKNESQDC